MTEARILFCVNDSTRSRRAAYAVALRHWPKGTEIRFLTVVNPEDYSVVGLLDERISQVRRLHQELVNRLSATPVICTSNIREGDVLKAILEETEEWRPSRIFIGTRGRNGLTRLFRPRLASAVQARVDCPVEIIGDAHTVRDSFNRLAMATARYLK